MPDIWISYGYLFGYPKRWQTDIHRIYGCRLGYVTIISQSGCIIGSSYPLITENHSVIIDKEGYVKRAQYRKGFEEDESNIWTDTEGKYHEPLLAEIFI